MSGGPRGSAPAEGRGGEAHPGAAPVPARPVVAVVSAPWAGPSRPAPTVLRELGRRWGDAVQVLLVEDPTEDLLASWGIDVLPTWLRFRPGGAVDGGHDGPGLVLSELAGCDLEGNQVALRGPWHLELRREGAQPKHVIDAEFGPGR